MFAGLSQTKNAFATEADSPRISVVAPVMPPFWELEELIAQGHPTTDALAIMARRHASQAVPVILSGHMRPDRASAERFRLSA